MLADLIIPSFIYAFLFGFARRILTTLIFQVRCICYIFLLVTILIFMLTYIVHAASCKIFYETKQERASLKFTY